VAARCWARRRAAEQRAESLGQIVILDFWASGRAVPAVIALDERRLAKRRDGVCLDHHRVEPGSRSRRLRNLP